MLRAAVVLSLSLVTALAAEDWPGWRGPRGDGTSSAKGVPAEFSPTKNVLWSADVPGSGYSSPVVSKGTLFLTACDEKTGERTLRALDAISGKEKWAKVVLTAKLEKMHHLNSRSSGTPACDGERVYVSFLDDPAMRVYCYDVAGKLLWSKSPGKLLSRHGFCTSPVLHNGLVILNGDQDAKAFVVALDKLTGEEKWRADRPNKTRSYCTPILIPCPVRKGVTQLVLSGSKCVTGYDADTGKLLWIHDGPTEQYVASLVYDGATLFLTTGFPEYHLMGIRPTGEGNITGTKHVAWHLPHKVNQARGAAYVPSPLYHDGRFYVVSDPGFLNCIDAKSGERVYQRKLGRRHSASPVLVEGRMIIPDDDGKVWVVKADGTTKEIACNEMKEAIYASPAVADGRLYLRTLTKVYCVSAAR